MSSTAATPDMLVPIRPSDSSDPPEAVVRHWSPVFDRTHWTRVPATDGFSGAVLWKGGSEGREDVVLRRYPRSESQTDGNPIIFRHAQIRAASDRGFRMLARPIPPMTGGGWMFIDGYLWEMSEWLRGQAVDAEKVTNSHLTQIGGALGKLHKVWRDAGPVGVGPSPGIEKRIRMLEAAKPSKRLVHPELKPLYQRFREFRPDPTERLPILRGLRLPIQTIIGDARLEHFLFALDRIQGIIDLTTMRIDSPLIDLARVLSELDGVNSAWELIRLGCMGSGMFFPDEAEASVNALIETGSVCACLFWFEKIDRECLPDQPIPEAVYRRLEESISRLR